MRVTILAFVAAFLCGSKSAAVDFSKVPRHLTEEPAYQSKSPQYCLLAFGAKLKHQVWLVRDGNRLFVDRNGDRKLTGIDEKVSETPMKARAGTSVFVIGDLIVGKARHKNFVLQTTKISTLSKETIKNAAPAVAQLYKQNPKGVYNHLSGEIAMPRLKSDTKDGLIRHVVGLDSSGLLQFSDNIKTAPIVHFGGSFHVRLFEHRALSLETDNDVRVNVGTPGAGQGTFAMVAYENLIPKNAHPKLEITWPSKRSGSPPIVTKHYLKQRC